MRCALISVVIFQAFSEPQAVRLVISALDLATKSLYALVRLSLIEAYVTTG
jgi:hypothetical protein